MDALPMWPLAGSNAAEYTEVRRFLGATVGRYANRIANGTFELDGQRFQLPINDCGANTLHGGAEGFDRKNWTISATGDWPAPLVALSYLSPDGEEGYPGRLQTGLTCSISGGMELSVAFSSVTDKPTIVNLTNHSFFNLLGAEGSSGILDHRLTIPSDSYLPVEAIGIPMDGPSPVDGTPFDFRDATLVGERLRDPDQQIHIRQGYDHCYCLPGGTTAEPRFAASIEDLSSGRTLKLFTNQPRPPILLRQLPQRSLNRQVWPRLLSKPSSSCHKTLFASPRRYGASACGFHMSTILATISFTIC